MSSQVHDTATAATEPPLILGEPTFASVTERISRICEMKTPKAWYVAFGIALSMLGVFAGVIGYLIWEGIGIWGNNVPNGWGWDIVNFVWWVGIGHAGTLISAILFLLRQRWRTSINRFAEAMTLFAVMCALTLVAIAASYSRGGLASATSSSVAKGFAQSKRSR